MNLYDCLLLLNVNICKFASVSNPFRSIIMLGSLFLFILHQQHEILPFSIFSEPWTVLKTPTTLKCSKNYNREKYNFTFIWDPKKARSWSPFAIYSFYYATLYIFGTNVNTVQPTILKSLITIIIIRIIVIVGSSNHENKIE